MRTRHLLLVLPLFASAFAQDKPKAASKSGILVLNVFRAIEECDEGRAVVNRIREEKAAKVQDYTDRMAKLQEKVKELREKKPQDHTAEYYKEFEATMAEYARLEVDKNVFVTLKGDDLTRSLQQIILGAQEAAREEMKARGAELVLFSKLGPVEVATENDFNQELLMRRVICADPSIDITDDVIKRMNEWYKTNRNAQGVPKRDDEGPAKEKKAAGDAKAKDPAKAQ